MALKLKYDSTDSFSLPLGTFLTDRNIALADVDDIVVMVKNKRSDADVDAIATVTLGSGVTKDEAQNLITFSFGHSDFGGTGMLANNTYKIGVGFKTPSLTKYLEPCLEDDELVILPDFIHD